MAAVRGGGGGSLVLLAGSLHLAAMLCVCNCILVESHGKETDDAFVTLELDFQGVYEFGLRLEFNEIIEPGGLVLDRVRELFKPPILFVHDLAAVVGDEFGVLGNRFLHLFVRQNGSCNENGFVLF